MIVEVVFESPDNFKSEELIFDIVPFRRGYHVPLGCNAFARFNAVLDYAYIKLKMPGPNGVTIVNGNTKCSLRMEEQTRTFVAKVQAFEEAACAAKHMPSSSKHVRAVQTDLGQAFPHPT